MTISAWRVVHRQYADNAFSGEGSRFFGGRWNFPGRRAVYLSQTLSLAILETIVHAEDLTTLPALVCFRVEFAESAVASVRVEDLPSDWRDRPDHEWLRNLGTEFMIRGATVSLSVPSAVVPLERNYVLNSSHPAFAATIRIDPPIPLPIDPRLLSLTRTTRTPSSPPRAIR